ncbi:hypothetical protein [Neisseria musculi]|uniref:hypothetical protein n=1 Tax=Neisseria musculi TaxID=1815583 RepID=UPI003618F500
MDPQSRQEKCRMALRAFGAACEDAATARADPCTQFVGSNPSIAAGAARLRELAASGGVPPLLAVQENSLMMGHLCGRPLQDVIAEEAAAGSLSAWRQQGLAANWQPSWPGGSMPARLLRGT